MSVRWFLTVAAIMLAGCADYSPFAHHYYLDEESIPVAVIGTPIQPKTTEWKKQIQAVIAAQKNARKDALEQARIEHTQLTSDIFVTIANPKLTRQNAPHTFQLLDHVKEDCMDTSAALKEHWKIPRPYLTDARVKPLLQNPSTSSSFPSSHTACSKVVADILSDLYPHKRKELLSRAEQSGYYRMILGLHYPHDLQAGKKLARAFYEKLKQLESFKRDLRNASTERKGSDSI